MLFAGFLLFCDLPKAGVAEIAAGLERLGIELTIIIGDKRQFMLGAWRRKPRVETPVWQEKCVKTH